MSTEMTLPKLGESKAKGIVLAVRVSEGDHVDEGDIVLELETDKATTEVPADVTGTVQAVHVAEGDEITSGTPLLTVDEGGQDAHGQSADEGVDTRDEAASEAGSEGEEDGAADAAPRKPGAGSGAGSADAEEPSEAAEHATDTPSERTEPRAAGAPSTQRSPLGALASPSIRALARRLGVDIDQVAGTGEGGRITEEDVESHVRHVLEEQRERAAADEEPGEPELPDFSAWGEVEREPLSATRRTIAEGIARSWERIPHVTQYDRADVTDLEAARTDLSEEHDAPITVTAVLVALLAEALQRFPRFNSSLDLEAGERVLKRYVHVGVAVDTDRGLLVPVVRDADDKGLVAIARELDDLAGRARSGDLDPEEMQGATCSITNLGGLGTTRFTPIISWPQVAILSVGRAATQPVWQDDAFVPRQILPLGITYDHRAVDGADAARFLRWIAEVLEQPLRLTAAPGQAPRG